MALTLNDPALGVLGGIDEVTAENPIEDKGRSITVDWQQAGSNQDVELYGYSLRFWPAEEQGDDYAVGSANITGVSYGSGIYGVGPYSGGIQTVGLFTLNISTLGELILDAAETTFQDRGRTIQLDWSQSGQDQDLELSGYSIRFYPAEEQSEET